MVRSDFLLATLFVGAILLDVPTRGRAQGPTVTEEATSWWQRALFSVEWKEVERFQQEMLDYREAGAIGAYEIRIRRDGEDFDAWVAAEVVDAIRLGQLRGLDTVEDHPERAGSLSQRSDPSPEPSFPSSPLPTPRGRR
jgi:hypothetical protein